MSNRWLTIPAGVLVAAGVFAATIPASAESKAYNLSGFKRIDVSAGVDVVVRQGPFSIEAQESRGDFDDLRIELKGDRLEIGRKGMMRMWSRKSYSVTVSAPELTRLEASSGASISARDITAGDIRVEASSGSDIEISGTCDRLEVESSSGADVNARDLKCRDVMADASSGADIRAFASQNAKGEASSGADIDFFGEPATRDFKKSSGGDVSFRG
ncbi:hypothetical protein GC169_08120 [bacterium]|nr:hypothetical protein [bacterium]